MLILERSVTKYYWLKMYRLLYRKLQSGAYARLQYRKQFLVVRILHGSRTRSYAIVIRDGDHLRPVAWLYLWQKPGWAAWEVMQVFVFEKLRGRGFSKLLYKAAIENDRLMIASGKTQSSSSRGLWKSFVKNRTFNIYAIDYWNLRDRSQVFMNDGELWCDMDIYSTGTYQERDVRLIATRKKK